MYIVEILNRQKLLGLQFYNNTEVDKKIPLNNTSQYLLSMYTNCFPKMSCFGNHGI